MSRIVRILRDELHVLVQWVIMHLPDGHLGARIRRRYWRARLRNDTVHFVGYGAKIHGCDLLVLGERFVFGERATLEIGDSDPVYIGSDVSIANGTYMRSANHRFDDLSVPIRQQGHASKRIEYRGRQYSIVIEDDVWLGARSIILTGAFIGEGSVIAAGSVVSSTVPAFSVVAGNPARVIANRKKMAELKQAAGGDNVAV